jgi:pyruvate/2-oxoglutarate dehydrogenase complex dihydrolipoamide acyltransferase (E2) component
MQHEVPVPDLGGAASEAFLSQWFKEVGETVAAQEDLVELVTDKANVVVEAPVAGTVTARHFDAEDRVEIGEVLCLIDDGA